MRKVLLFTVIIAIFSTDTLSFAMQVAREDEESVGFKEVEKLEVVVKDKDTLGKHRKEETKTENLGARIEKIELKKEEVKEEEDHVFYNRLGYSVLTLFGLFMCCVFRHGKYESKE